jgi:UDP-2-acetamido-2,6-beta-L-arabino-hexul-4-ose reductase
MPHAIVDCARRTRAARLTPVPIQPDLVRVARDARGLVFEPLDATELAGQRNVHVVLTRPGYVRGNHHHLLATEIFALAGPAFVRLRVDGHLQDHVIPEGQVWRFTIPPGVAHAIRHDGPGPGTLVSFSSRPHDPQNPDTFRDVLLESVAASLS